MATPPAPTIVAAVGLSASDNEGAAQETRLTREGRQIVYRVNVLQHPEKARACGQGAKSSTDRRPVDPPPVLDLHVYELDNDGTEKDITYAYRANFFMWASLESARPLAQGRLPKDPTAGPVLCGTPVSGISYLDRPNPAGYFIFPDLSVRHEGRYRLCFTLYEELRDHGMADHSENYPTPPSTASAQHLPEQVNGRCVIRTEPFTVFSAKKFPGLSESTILSRTVAEQGCRVRIRRDVRMRRRDNKDSKDDWGEEDEDERAPPQLPSNSSPEQPEQRQHLLQQIQQHQQQQQQQQQIPPPPNQPLEAASTTTSVGNILYQPPIQGLSGPELHSQYQAFAQQSMPPPAPQHNYPPPAPRQYDQQPMPPQYPQPQYVQHQQIAQSPQQMSHFQPPPYGYTTPQYNPYTGTYSYVPPQQMHSTVYAQPPPPPPPPPQQTSHLRHDSLSYVPSPHEYQANANMSQYANHVHPAPLGLVDNGTQSQASLTHSTMPANPSCQVHRANPSPTSPHSNPTFHGKALPPIQTTSHQPYDAAHTNTSIAPAGFHTYQQQAPPVYTSLHLEAQAPRPPPPQYISGAASNAPKSKRSFGSTFSTQHMDQPLRSGARPDPSAQNNYSYNVGQENYSSNSEDEDHEPVEMVYKRADGSVVSRRWPTLHS